MKQTIKIYILELGLTLIMKTHFEALVSFASKNSTRPAHFAVLRAASSQVEPPEPVVAAEVTRRGKCGRRVAHGASA